MTLLRDLRLLLAATLMLLASGTRADERAALLYDGMRFPAAMASTVAVIEGGVKAFSVFLGRKKAYTVRAVPANFPLGTLFVSNDGRFVTWMLAAHFFDRPGASGDRGPGLVFFVDGKPVRTWSYRELMARPELVSLSTSHVQWIMEYRKPDWSPGDSGVKFAPDGSRLELETTSFRHYVFDPRTGRQLLAEDSAVYREAELILYAEIKPGEPELTSAVFYFVKGSPAGVKPPLRFRDPSGSYRDAGFATIALRRKGDHWETLRGSWELPILYNALTR